MSSRLSPLAALALVAVAAFTAWITWRAKALEEDLGVNSTKAAIVGKAAPDFRLPSLDGATVTMADYRGKKKLAVVFWASWNNGSHPAMLALNGFYKQVHTPDSDFEMVAVSVDDDRAAARKFVNDSKLTLPVLLDKGQSVTRAFQVRSIPTVMLIDTSGKVAFGRVGYDQRLGIDLARQLGIANYRMEFGAPNAGRRN